MNTVEINGVYHTTRRMAIEKVNSLFDKIDSDKEESDVLVSIEDMLLYIEKNKPQGTTILIRSNNGDKRWFVHFTYGNQTDGSIREIYKVYTDCLSEALRQITHIVDFVNLLQV